MKKRRKEGKVGVEGERKRKKGRERGVTELNNYNLRVGHCSLPILGIGRKKVGGEPSGREGLDHSSSLSI